jgi:hypothetical protein
MRFAGRALGNFVRFLALVEFPGAAGREQAEAAARRLSAEWPNPDLWDGLRRMAAVAKAYRWQGWILRLANAAAVAGMAMAVALAGGAILRRRRIAWDAGFGVLVALGLVAYLLFCAIAINVQVRYVFTVWPLIVSAGLLAVLIPAHRVGLGSRAAA